MKTYFYLIRHGQTDWNSSRRLQGRTDIPLNDEGRKQCLAARNNPEIAQLKPELIFSSPLIRSLETAQLIFPDYADSIQTDPRLIERSFGQYEGVVVDNIFGLKMEDDPAFSGETKDQVNQRMVSFFKEMSEKYPGKPIVIVTHGAAITSFLRVSFSDLYGHCELGISNCSLTIISCEKGHLEPVKVDIKRQ